MKNRFLIILCVLGVLCVRSSFAQGGGENIKKDKNGNVITGRANFHAGDLQVEGIDVVTSGDFAEQGDNTDILSMTGVKKISINNGTLLSGSNAVMFLYNSEATQYSGNAKGVSVDIAGGTSGVLTAGYFRTILNANTTGGGAINPAGSRALIGHSDSNGFNVSLQLGVNARTTSDGHTTNAIGLGAMVDQHGGAGGLQDNAIGVLSEVVAGQDTTAANEIASITNAVALKGVIRKTPSVTNNQGAITGSAKGLSLEGWSCAICPTNSYGIYADNSIGIGTNKYFIYSLSTAPSLFTGTVQSPVFTSPTGTMSVGYTSGSEGSYFKFTPNGDVQLFNKINDNYITLSAENANSQDIVFPTEDGELLLKQWRYSYTAADQVVDGGDSILVDTSSSVVTITLPASPSFGDRVTLIDAAHTWATNNLTVNTPLAGGQEPINGVIGDFTANVDGERLECVFSASPGFGWSITRSSAGGGGSGDVSTDAIWNVKGDMAIATANDTAARLPIGANNTILVADSSQTTGMRWGAPSTVSGILALDANNNIAVNRVNQGYALTSTGGTVTLTAASAPQQYFTGGSAHNVNLPDVTTIPVGTRFFLHNVGSSPTGQVNIRTSAGGANIVGVLPSATISTPVTTATVTSILNTGTTTASWSIDYQGATFASGKFVNFLANMNFTSSIPATESTLNIGGGGTLGTAAFTDATAYEVPLTFGTGLTRSTNNITAAGALADIAGLTSSQGDILYYNGTNWVRLPKGTNGQFLKIGATVPSWAAVPGGGDMLAANNLSDLASAATARTNLGLAIGTNVQAFDTDLSTWGAISLSGGSSGALADFLADPTSAKLGLALSDELNPGSGKIILSPGGLNVTSGKTLAATHSLTLAGTDSTTHTFPATSSTLARTDAAQTFTGAQTITAGSITGLTGFALRDTSAAFDVTFAATSSTALTAARIFTLDMVNAAKTLRLTNSIDLASDGTGVRQLNIGAGGTLGSAAFTAASAYAAVASNLSDLASASAARTNLGLAIGTNVQAFDSDLTIWAGIAPGTGVGAWLAVPSSANFFAAISDESGTGLAIAQTGPTIIAPTIAKLANLTSNGIVKTSSGDGTLSVAVDGTDFYSVGGTPAVGKAPIWDGDSVEWTTPTNALYAPLASPTFTGVPAAPTAAVDTNTTQLATTAFVLAQAASSTPAPAGTAAIGSSARYARADHVHASQTTVTGNAGTATALATGRTIGITGDATWTSPSFDGTSNVTAALTLATVTNAKGGTGYTNNSTPTPTPGLTDSANFVVPIEVYVKSVPTITSGAPADIARIKIPAGITRWRAVASATTATTSTLIQETVSATNAAAVYVAWDGAGATGTQIMGNVSGQATAPLAASWGTNGVLTSTSDTIYIRQTTASANAGTVSFYIYIMPLP